MYLQSLSYLPVSEITHTICVLPVCPEKQLISYQPPWTTTTPQTHTASPPPLPQSPAHIHHNYAQQEFKSLFLVQSRGALYQFSVYYANKTVNIKIDFCYPYFLTVMHEKLQLIHPNSEGICASCGFI